MIRAWYARHSPLFVAAVLAGVAAGLVAAIYWPRPEGFTIRRSGAYLEVWQGDDLKGEYSPEDGESYELLDDLARGRL